VLSLPFASIEGSTTSFSPVDTFRWGQDGLAILTSTGNLYLLRGPAIVPQLLNTNTPATLSSSFLTSITHGTGNTVLTLTGTNFVPGVAALWNGSYRTTTIVDGTHVTMAIPASDLAADGSAMITLVNPWSPGVGSTDLHRPVSMRCASQEQPQKLTPRRWGKADFWSCPKK